MSNKFLSSIEVGGSLSWSGHTYRVDSVIRLAGNEESYKVYLRPDPVFDEVQGVTLTILVLSDEVAS